MGNGHSTSDSLPYRIRYNDPSLTELGLTTALDGELDAVIGALPRNRTIRSAVLFDAFTAHVLQRTLWWNFLDSLVAAKSLQQVEFLETDVPLETLRILLLQKPTLETLAVSDGIQLGSITPDAIRRLGAAILERQHAASLQLREFVWECNFDSVLHCFPDRSNTCPAILDPLLAPLGGLPNLELLGLVNSCHSTDETRTTVTTPSQPLLSPNGLFQFCSPRRHTLHTLDLSGCGLQDEHFVMLRKALMFQQKQHQHLSPVSKTAASVSEEQPRPSGSIIALKRLQVQRNHATDMGLEELVKLAESNETLQTLISDATGSLQQRIELWLAWNQRVRVTLGQEPSLRALGTMAVSLRESPEFLFLLLRKYPQLYYL